MKNVISLSFMFLLFSTSIFAQAGLIDSTFGSDGTVYLMDDVVYDDMIELDNETVILSGFYTIADNTYSVLTKVNLEGELETGFGVNGTVSYGEAFGFNAYNIEILDDNRFLVYGEGNNSGNKVSVFRYYNNGLIDSTFGDNGMILLDVDGDFDYSMGLKILPDQSFLISYGIWQQAFVMKKYTPNGTLDTTFGNQGTAKIMLSSDLVDFFAPSIEILDDKILLMGTVNGEDSNSGVAVLKLNMDGTIDTTYGVNGWVHVPIEGWDIYGIDFCRLNSGGMHFSGTIVSEDGESNFFTTVQLRLDGTLDMSYGENGIATYPLPFADYAFVYASVLQPDGKIVVCGSLDYSSQLLCRLNEDGSLDSTFGINGFGFYPSPDYDEAIAGNLALMSDLSIWTVGYFDGDLSLGTVTKFKSGLMTGTNSPSHQLIPMTVYPNPVKDDIHVQFDLEEGGEVALDLLTLAGKKVASLDASWFPSGKNEKNYLLPSNLPKGNYLLTLRAGEGVSSFVVTVE